MIEFRYEKNSNSLSLKLSNLFSLPLQTKFIINANRKNPDLKNFRKKQFRMDA